MTSPTSNGLDGNAAAGELSNIFSLDLTAAEGQWHGHQRKRYSASLFRLSFPRPQQCSVPSGISARHLGTIFGLPAFYDLGKVALLPSDIHWTISVMTSASACLCEPVTTK
jgi:hypothetical protein